MLIHLNKLREKPSRVVILGGSGFVGKELSATLDALDIPNIKISSYDIDLTQQNAGELLAKKLQPKDALVFLSALTPDKGKGLEAFDKNIRMAVNVVKALELQKVAHVVYFSSDAIYSMQETIVSEGTIPNPEDMYGLMHLTRERMLKFSFGNLAVIRPTLVYGLHDTHNSYGPNRFRRMAAEKQEITLFGKGEEKRDHIFVGDLVALTTEVLLWKSIGDINAVTGKSISYFDLAAKINTLFDNQIKIIDTERKNPVTYRHFDNAQVFKSFPGFQFISIEDGLSLVHKGTLRGNDERN